MDRATGTLTLAVFACASLAVAQPRTPTASLVRAEALTLPGVVDSNSPAVWEATHGVPTLHVVTSVDGQPSRAEGGELRTLRAATAVAFSPRPPHGVWMEAIVPDADGTWYGYYHNEIPADALCGDASRTLPRIGAAKSVDFGATWQDLGILLEAPTGSHDCASPNRYFVGGVGDFSIALDHGAAYLYIFYSQYPSRAWRQGIAVARLPWAERDRPSGRVDVWRDGVWLPVESQVCADEAGETTTQWLYPAATPIYAVADSWHDQGTSVDAYWGPSVHWNTHLQMYVMLLSRAIDTQWTQEGVYVSFAASLEDPRGWSELQKLTGGGAWYPQVIGTEPGTGTDRTAGVTARFFVGGRSEHLILFHR